jgi:hypothetical protein
MITHLTLRLRQGIQDWIRREIIDFDPYDFEDASPVTVRSERVADKALVLTK